MSLVENKKLGSLVTNEHLVAVPSTTNNAIPNNAIALIDQSVSHL